MHLKNVREQDLQERVCSYLKAFLYKLLRRTPGTSDRTSPSVTPCSSNNFRTLEALMTSGFPSGSLCGDPVDLGMKDAVFWENADHCLVVASCYRIKKNFRRNVGNMKDRTISTRAQDVESPDLRRVLAIL